MTDEYLSSFIRSYFKNNNSEQKPNLANCEDDEYTLSSMQSLQVCHECYALFGPIYIEDGQKVEQRCICYPNEEEIWVVNNGEYKTRYDYNHRYETCYCCGLRIIECGSRWSSFYCLDCKSKISRLNKAIGLCVIPFGRHSIMNGVFLDRSAITEQNKQAVEAFTLSSTNMFSLIDLACEYRKIILVKQINMIGLPQKGTVLDLMLLIEKLGDLNALQDEAFFGLFAYVAGKRPEEAKDFYINRVMKI